MFNIKDFLGKIQNVRAKEIMFRSAVEQGVKKITGIDIPAETISNSSSILKLKGVNQSARSVIFIKKQAILEEINATQKIRVITDIR